MRSVAPICATLILALSACAHLPAGDETPASPPVAKTPPKLVEQLKLLRWQIDLTAEVAYRDPDPAKRRAFLDFHSERVALYAIVREHARDPEALETSDSAARDTLRRLRELRSPEAVAYCDANPKEAFCVVPK